MAQLFEYYRPGTRSEALKLLSDPDHRNLPLVIQPRPVAPRSMDADAFVDLSLLGLDAIQPGADGSIRIGSLVSLQAMIESPLLVKNPLPLVTQASSLVTGPGLRNMAGLWGAIQPPYGSPEFLLALLVLEARLTLIGVGEMERMIPLSEYLAMGDKVLTMGELVTDAVIPDQGDCSWALERVARTLRDEAIVAAAVTMAVENGKVVWVRLALAGASSLPVRLFQLEKDLTGKVLDAQRIQSAATAAMDHANPIGDYRGGVDYRREMAAVVVGRVLESAWKKVW